MPGQEDVWIYAEHRDGDLLRPSLGLISEAKGVASGLGGRLGVVVVGQGLDSLPDVVRQYGADFVYQVETAEDYSFRPDSVAVCITRLHKAHSPAALLFAATTLGKEIAARVAAGLGAPLAADCLVIKAGGGRLSTVRSVLGGQANSVADVVGRPLVATMRLEVLGIGQASPKSDIEVTRIGDSCPSPVEILEFCEADPKTRDLVDADIVVAAGRGVGSAEGFAAAEGLASVIGASMGGTRPARDAGWIGLNRQIGQTGKTVTPRMLLAFGVSGAPQFTIGMKDSSFVVAVNSDKHAPILSIADIGIQGDAPEIIQALLECLSGT